MIKFGYTRLKILLLALIWLVIMIAPVGVMAVANPRGVSNNKLGVHILDPNEIEDAAKFVNNNGQGSWGWVVVPIQAWDRDLVKWGKFMEKAAELKVIPIIRVATYGEGDKWVEPNNYDLVDFANFLNDLQWPVKNRYVVIFNEVNRADEYGGYVSPEKYADILVNAINIFKERNEDFFIMPAGLDNAAPSNNKFLRWDEYWRRVVARQPEVFNKIDGWVSHAYPNPAFSGRVTDRSDHSIVSYQYDLALVSRYTSKDLPVFITETGWDMSKVGEEKTAENFEKAFSSVWNDGRVVMVSPFLLRAVGEPFEKFSLLRSNQPGVVYERLEKLASRGEPEMAGEVAGIESETGVSGVNSTIAEVKNVELMASLNKLWDWFKNLFGYEKKSEITKVIVSGHEYSVEVVKTAEERRLGLSNRDSLGDNEGMLFIFDAPGFYNFWMKEMKFDIDIVWISGDRVVSVSQGKYKNEFDILRPSEKVDRVLEVNAGSGIKKGDVVKWE